MDVFTPGKQLADLFEAKEVTARLIGCRPVHGPGRGVAVRIGDTGLNDCIEGAYRDHICQSAQLFSQPQTMDRILGSCEGRLGDLPFFELEEPLRLSDDETQLLGSGQRLSRSHSLLLPIRVVEYDGVG